MIITRRKMLWRFGRENWWLVFLLVYGFLVRVGYPLTGSFAFLFDHGKDSLNVLEMLVTWSPKLVGPWTSIPGLYFGPAWYYFLAVTLILGNLSPTAPVWGMVILGLVQIYLAGKYFGKIAAVMVAGASLWLTVTTSAWNPFPLTLVSWILLILLAKTSKTGKLSLKMAFWMGLTASLGFHFSSAYAIFYPVIILLCWLCQRLKITGTVILVMIAGFLIPFGPQLVFEWRHNFSETQAVMMYFRQGGGEGDKFGLTKLGQVLGQTWGEIKLAVQPDINLPDQQMSRWLRTGWTWLLVGVAINFAYQMWRKKIKRPVILVEAGIFVVVPVIGLCFLHFNLWYLLGLMPAAVVVVSTVINRQPRWVKWVWVVGILIGGVSVNMREFWWQDIGQNNRFYRQVAATWEKVKRLGGDENFAVYTYQSEIYDFAYQYLILREGLVNHYRVPGEFSYQKGEVSYVPNKQVMMEKLTPREGEVKRIIYIVDNPDEKHKYFLEWQGQQEHWRDAELMGVVGENIQIWRWEATAETQMTSD